MLRLKTCPLSRQVSSLKAERRRLNNELEDARNQVDDLERQKKKLAAELAKVRIRSKYFILIRGGVL